MIIPQEDAKPLNICVIGKTAKPKAEVSIDASATEVYLRFEHHDIIPSPDQDMIMIDHAYREMHTSKLSDHDLAYEKGVNIFASPIKTVSKASSRL